MVQVAHDRYGRLRRLYELVIRTRGEEVEKLQKTYEKLSKEKDETKERATQGRNHAPARWRRGGTHWFSSTGINDDDFKFAKAVKKAAAKASATDEL